MAICPKTGFALYSDTAFNIANKYSDVLSSETRDLAAWIDKAIEDERERCAKIASEFSEQGDWHEETADCIAASIRNSEPIPSPE